MLCSKCHKAPSREGYKLCHGCALYARRQRQRARARESLPVVPPLPIEVAQDAPAPDGEAVEQPRVRGECGDIHPCPWVSCRWHLLFERPETRRSYREGGGLKSDEELLKILEGLPATCALDVADLGGVDLAVVGRLLGVSRERIRQIECAVTDPVRSFTVGPEKRKLLLRRHGRLLAQLLDVAPEDLRGDASGWELE